MATANEKVISQEVFEQSLKDILQIIANNCYNWKEYTDSEISDILEITDTQAMELSKIINDSTKATNKLWSSNKVDEAIKSGIIEANQYADELVGNISSISLEYVTELPTIGDSNVIYILQGTPNTLNVYKKSTSEFVTVGNLDIDFTKYYNKTEVDALLIKKANSDEVVSTSKIVNDMSSTSNDTVLSTEGLKAELDKVVKISSVSDVPLTKISTFSDNSISGDLFYYIKNGICNVSIVSLTIPTIHKDGSFFICPGLPKPFMHQYAIGCDGCNTSEKNEYFINIDGALYGNIANTLTNWVSFTYPVVES